MKYLILLFGLLFTTATFACRCKELPALDKTQFDSYEGIIIGKVIAFELVGGWMNHTVEILKIYKGEFTSEQIIVASNNNSCGLRLREGRNYLIYGSVYSNQINISLCTRTKCINEDLEHLSQQQKEQYQSKIKIELDFLEEKAKENYIK